MIELFTDTSDQFLDKHKDILGTNKFDGILGGYIMRKEIELDYNINILMDIKGYISENDSILIKKEKQRFNDMKKKMNRR